MPAAENEQVRSASIPPPAWAYEEQLGDDRSLSLPLSIVSRHELVLDMSTGSYVHDAHHRLLHRTPIREWSITSNSGSPSRSARLGRRRHGPGLCVPGTYPDNGSNGSSGPPSLAWPRQLRGLHLVPLVWSLYDGHMSSRPPRACPLAAVLTDCRTGRVARG